MSELEQGKSVWITGASSGIGEALAREYAEGGARLILSARRKDRLEDLKRSLPNPESHLIVALDVSLTEDIPSIVDSVLGEVGHLDILVNNAGVSQRASVVDTDIEMDRRLFEVNFFGAVAMTRALLPALIAVSGSVVVISSATGKLQTPGRSAYCASKHALQGWFDALRCEVWRDGVQVLLVTPGFVRTELSYAALEASGKPRGRMDKNQETGMSAALAAKKIVKARRRGCEEYYVGGLRERVGIWLKRFVPRLYSGLAKRFPAA